MMSARPGNVHFRKTISQVIGGAAVLIAAGIAYYGTLQTAHVSERAVKASQDLLISQQVSKGFEDLGSTGDDKLMVRLGGIYALEGVMNDPGGQYDKPVLEALCAFVRDGTKNYKGDGPPATDIQAALTVIGRRTGGAKAFGDVNLIGARIPKANLLGAKLIGALLTDADLTGAHLDGAYLNSAGLTGARLDGAYMSADLDGAGLSRAVLVGANLRNTDLHGANLSGADLIGTDLRDTNVTQEQLDKACGSTETKLPPKLTIKPCPAQRER
jgi:hypothetical protein